MKKTRRGRFQSISRIKIRPAGRIRRFSSSRRWSRVGLGQKILEMSRVGSGQYVFGYHVPRRVNLARPGPPDVT